MKISKHTWKKIIEVLITVLTALGTVLGAQACGIA